MGILAPIDSSKNLKREEHLKPDCSDCSCQCVCSEKVRAVVHQFVVYNDCKQEDAKPQTRAGCCNQLQVVPPERRYHALVATTHCTCKRNEEINEFKFADKVPAHIEELYVDSVSRLTTDEQRKKLAILFKEFAYCFATTSDYIGKTTLLRHDIDTGDGYPVKQRCQDSRVVTSRLSKST